MNDNDDIVTSVFEPAEIENDLARSAWNDHQFAVWFMPYAKKDVLFNGGRGADFFLACGEFAKQHKAAPASVGERPEMILHEAGAAEWFRSMEFSPLPGGKTHKPTSWQMEKARKYLRGRHNSLLAERLRDAEEIRSQGDNVRADRIANEARRLFATFSDSAVPCRKALSDIDAILALAESNPPLFKLDGEIGRMLNSRLKPDNLGILLANQKVGKTTDLVTLAVEAAKQVPTLFISTGDESELKINARVGTNLSFKVTLPEYAGRKAMPVPDCAHNAAGTCPILMGAEPRQIKDWKVLIRDGAERMDLAEGRAEGSRTVSGGLYQPCCRCFPRNDGTKEDAEKRRRWKSAIWWRVEEFPLVDRETLEGVRSRFDLMHPNGGLRVASYGAGELTVEGIYELLDTLDRTEGFVPQVIVIDYADLMKQEKGRDSDKDHDGMRRIWEGLRALTSKLCLLLITATQTNREGGDVETHTVRTIGRCAKAADNCTWFLTLNQTVQERRAKVFRASMLFAREGDYDPEHQTLCCQWQDIQDGFAFSMPVFCKIKNERERDRRE